MHCIHVMQQHECKNKEAISWQGACRESCAQQPAEQGIFDSTQWIPPIKAARNHLFCPILMQVYNLYFRGLNKHSRAF